MNRLRIILTVLVLTFLPFAGIHAQKYDGVIDKTVAQVGNSVILLSDIEEGVDIMKYQGYVSDRNLRCVVLENSLVSKLFYTQALLDSLTVNEDMVNAALNERINGILSRFGGEEATEDFYGKPLHKLRQEWREMFMEQNLVQEMQRKIAGGISEVTPKEVQQFYRKTPKDSLPVIPVQYQYSQIVIYPNVERANMAVRERLLEFRQRILDGEKFSLLATLYSEDNSAMRGGELGMSSKDVFWPAFSDAAMALKEGQVSPIVETPDGFHLIQMIEKKGNMFNARHILLRPRYTAEDRDSAFARLDSIRTVILEDSITFELAARKYSQDTKSRTNGGIVSDPNTGSPSFDVDRLKPADYRMLSTMKEGEISQPFESVDDEGSNGHTVYKIVRLDKVRPSHTATYENDFNVLLEVATNHKTMEAMEKFIRDKQNTTYIVIDPMFRGCDFEREGWIK